MDTDFLCRKRLGSDGFAAGMSGSRLAVAVGFAFLAMLEVILGQRQSPFKREMNRIGREGQRELVLNGPEFFEGADAAGFQLRFHANIVLFRSRLRKCSLARVAQFAAVRHHFMPNSPCGSRRTILRKSARLVMARPERR